eukprot:m.221836 g.221836  ORF g.221836 m.221836 type:complete len:1344 (+) comp18726_c4_seq3:629-4660(+)
MSDSNAVKVAVRVRPLNKREVSNNFSTIVTVNQNQVTVKNPDKSVDKHEKTKRFTFDHSFWSCNVDDDHFVNQEQVFEHLGEPVLDNAFTGYNSCIFAYGQTGSGKTFTMTGSPDQPGIIPRLCSTLFERIEFLTSQNTNLEYQLEVSYMEIYNESVRDLLCYKPKAKLRVREHKTLGPYVAGLSKFAVKSAENIEVLMKEGNEYRSTASTDMNATSSRSHAIFEVRMTSTEFVPEANKKVKKKSKIVLVDLAGSERQSKTKATGERLKEGANINKSLTTLGLVISALAADPKKHKFAPFRDSVLTWLLKDNLGGNSKTVMVATVSPASDNFDETMSTLRYADNAKKIVNKAVINENADDKVLRELREEVERLRSGVAEHATSTVQTDEMRHKLAETEALMEEMSKSWEDKLRQTESELAEKEQLLQDHGASVTGQGERALRFESKMPHFVSMSDDPLAAEINIYTMTEGVTRIGRDDADPANDIVIWGVGTETEQCEVTCIVGPDPSGDFGDDDIEIVTMIPFGSSCFVNNERVEGPTKLNHASLVQLGESNVFRFNHPSQAAHMRKHGVAKTPGTPGMGQMLSTGRFLEQKRIEEQRRLEDMSEKVQAEQAELERMRSDEKQRLEEEAMQVQAEKEALEEALEEESLRLAEQSQVLEQERRKVEQERAKIAEAEGELRGELASQAAKLDEEKRELEAKLADKAAHEERTRREQQRLAEEAARIEAERQALEESLEGESQRIAEEALRLEQEKQAFEEEKRRLLDEADKRQAEQTQQQDQQQREQALCMAVQLASMEAENKTLQARLSQAELLKSKGRKSKPGSTISLDLSSVQVASVDPVTAWDTEAVCKWLESLRVNPGTVSAFRTERIVGLDLPDLENDDFDRLGLSGVERKRLRRGLDEVLKTSASASGAAQRVLPPLQKIPGHHHAPEIEHYTYTAELCMEAHEWDAARGAYEHALELDAGFLPALLGLRGIIVGVQPDYSKAMELLDEAKRRSRKEADRTKQYFERVSEATSYHLYVRGSFFEDLFDMYREASNIYTRGLPGPFCATRLGFCYAFGKGVPQSHSQAAELFKKGSAVHVGALCNLGHCYMQGEGIAQDVPAAFECFNAGAQLNHAPSLYALGNCYAKGEGVQRDPVAAYEWTKKASDQGHTQAQFTVGNALMNGVGVRQDEAAAFALFQKAAAAGHAGAMCNLGSCYHTGAGTMKDPMRAVAYFQQSADRDYLQALFNLGVCYVTGAGFEKNPARAAQYFRTAAERGHAQAQCNLGNCYNSGVGVKKDPKKAMVYFRMAAEQGHAMAVYNMGVCFESGLGVKKDKKKAAEYFDLHKQLSASGIASVC